MSRINQSIKTVDMHPVQQLNIIMFQKYGSGVHLTTNEEYALHFSTQSNALIVVEAVIGRSVKPSAS